MNENIPIVLLYGSMVTGGIQTLIVRYINHLVELGVPVSLVCKPGNLLEKINNGCDVFLYTHSLDLFRVSRSIKSKVNGSKGLSLISFDGPSLLDGLLLEILVPSICSHISGVFHPRALFMDEESLLKHTTYKLAVYAAGAPSIFFMNQECRSSHQRSFCQALKDAPLIPVPINAHSFSYVPREASNKVKVVSVGRYTPFKAYNLSAPAIIDESNKLGVEVYWTFYGWGSLKDKMISIAGSSKKAGFIQVRDELDYESLPLISREYDIFVGMGTSALEAASAGLPSIIAIDSCEYFTYGFLDKLPFGNVGEMLSRPPGLRISQCIHRFSLLPQCHRWQLAAECRKSAVRYTMEAFHDSITKQLSNSGRFRSNAFPKYLALLYASVVYPILVISAFPRRLFGLGRKLREALIFA